jgi:general secretion pathway protein N
MMRAARLMMTAAILLCGASEAQSANAPGALDLPPSNILPAPVEISPGIPSDKPADTATEPSGNPLWAIPLSSLSATRDRPLFTPTRRAPAQAVVGPVAAAPPPPVAPPAGPERPPLVLIGAIAGETEGFAVFLDQATNNVIRLRTGQDHAGWVLRSVKGREATLQKDLRTETLALPIPGAAPVLGLAPVPGMVPVPGMAPVLGVVAPPRPGGKPAEPEL